jgi:hypothetical protein
MDHETIKAISKFKSDTCFSRQDNSCSRESDPSVLWVMSNMSIRDGALSTQKYVSHDILNQNSMEKTLQMDPS